MSLQPLFVADGLPPQRSHNALKCLRELIDYVDSFQRGQLVPACPLGQLSWKSPLVRHGRARYTMIGLLRSHFIIRLGETESFAAETVLLVFTTPATVYQVPVFCGLHIPLFLWHNGVTQKRGPEFHLDHREPGFQIGASEVRMAIHSHLMARWRYLYERMPQPLRSSLFGQVLVRQYATFVVEKLRYLIFEVPKELWELNDGILSPIPTVRWSGPMGRFIWSSNNTYVFLHFILELARPVHRSISWRTGMARWNAEQVDDVRNEVVARIFLEADPPIPL